MHYSGQKIESWRRYYNKERPHSSLGYLTPKDFIAAFEENAQRTVA